MTAGVDVDSLTDALLRAALTTKLADDLGDTVAARRAARYTGQLARLFAGIDTGRPAVPALPNLGQLIAEAYPQPAAAEETPA